MSLPYLSALAMLARVKKLLGEDQVATSKYWTNAELYRYINDAYIEAARESKALEFIERVDTTADQQAYTLSANVGQVFRVAYDNRKIYNVTKWELDRTEPDWENQTGYVSHYMLTQQNNRTIRLYKAPDTSGGSVTFSGEYGVVVDIDDGTNTYSFSAEYGEVSDTAGTDWDENFEGEYGLIIDAGVTSNAFDVWATKNPDPLDTTAPAAAIPELPYWTHMGIAFRAASKALNKYSEHGEPATAEAYAAIANDYLKLLKGYVANRAGERTTTMGRPRNRQRRPAIWETEIVD